MTNFADAAVRFQAPREVVGEALVSLQEEWTAAGIQTPVMDEMGEIDPDAELELLNRLGSVSPSCDHSESLYGRCVSCGMTWAEQAIKPRPA